MFKAVDIYTDIKVSATDINTNWIDYLSKLNK
jgi:hypothetical protein